MDEMLDYPKVDPHGSPIPDSKGKVVWKDYSKLSDCEAGDTVRLSAVIKTTSEFLKFLNSRGMYLGLKIKIKSIEPFDKSIVISYDKRNAEVLSNLVCERLLVEKIG
jgi:DtxR family Mn-dependent transcriptional regulator